jgi:hypothetical protein
MRTSSISLRSYELGLRALRADARRRHDRAELVLACHSRATQKGQARSVGVNHGHSRAAHELVVPRSTSMNASREHA